MKYTHWCITLKYNSATIKGPLSFYYLWNSFIQGGMSDVFRNIAKNNKKRYLQLIWSFYLKKHFLFICWYVFSCSSRLHQVYLILKSLIQYNQEVFWGDTVSRFSKTFLVFTSISGFWGLAVLGPEVDMALNINHILKMRWSISAGHVSKFKTINVQFS